MLKALLARWFVALLAAFLVFPVVFVLWHGPDRDGGYLGGIMMMMLVQFISPFKLWLIPLFGGSLVAIGWQVAARHR